ncbi:MAG: metal-sensitive transcriptional regulator [Nocardioides sp.]|jgi:DNA-binding FrmR family transcriptional regulator
MIDVPAPRPNDAAPNAVILNRVRRAQGQLGGVQRMMEEGRDLGEVVAQLKAVTKALDKVAFTLLVEELQVRVADDAGPERIDEIERIFLALA